MAVELVEIVNPNGRKGLVAATYQPLVDGDLHKAPSQRSRDARDAAAMPYVPEHTSLPTDPQTDPAPAAPDTPDSDASTGDAPSDTQES